MRSDFWISGALRATLLRLWHKHPGLPASGLGL